MLTIGGESTGDSLSLVDDSYEEFVNRFDSTSGGTTERSIWSTDNGWSSDTAYYSPDISTVINEITSRADWCGGNALTLMVKTEGEREVYSRDGSSWQAPSLHIDYDPSSVDWSDTCLSLGVNSGIDDGGNDVMESSSGTLTRDSAVLALTNDAAEESTIELRFSSVDLPAGSVITSAYIELSSEGYEEGSVSLTVKAENSGDSNQINNAALSARNYLADSVIWDDVPEEDIGHKILTPDVSSLVQGVASHSAWEPGNSMLFTLKRNAGSVGTRSFSASESTNGIAARLFINYEQTASQLAGTPPVLRTAREDLIDEVLALHQGGFTPLVDAYLEATQYMRGDELVFGQQRGLQTSKDNLFRVSVESSYENGGGVYRPVGCDETDLDAEVCVYEEILGTPNYIEPEYGSCTANNIVLLTDGQANRNQSEAYISGLIGESCETRDNESDNCGVDLARWMFETDHDLLAAGQQSVVTHTVGFNISNGFLEDLAAAGGGSYFEATTSSELVSAFNSVLETTLITDSGYVAPTTTISLNNRLLNSNDIYYAMFSPSTRAHWDGNVKRFQLGVNSSTGDLEVQDSNGVAALNDEGVVKDTSQSWWSATSDGARWRMVAQLPNNA